MRLAPVAVATGGLASRRGGGAAAPAADQYAMPAPARARIPNRKERGDANRRMATPLFAPRQAGRRSPRSYSPHKTYSCCNRRYVNAILACCGRQGERDSLTIFLALGVNLG